MFSLITLYILVYIIIYVYIYIFKTPKGPDPIYNGCLVMVTLTLMTGSVSIYRLLNRELGLYLYVYTWICYLNKLNIAAYKHNSQNETI